MRSLFTILGLTLTLTSCCEPGIKDSFPVVDYTSYQDTVIKDVLPFFMDSILPRDSGYYPRFSFNIINAGGEADRFNIRIVRNGGGFEVDTTIQGHDTIRFVSPPLLVDYSVDPARYVYYETFFERDSSLAHLSRMRPSITIQYGKIDLGPEGCNTEANTLVVSPENF
jgi:hypothetical protein